MRVSVSRCQAPSRCGAEWDLIVHRYYDGCRRRGVNAPHAAQHSRPSRNFSVPAVWARAGSTPVNGDLHGQSGGGPYLGPFRYGLTLRNFCSSGTMAQTLLRQGLAGQGWSSDELSTAWLVNFRLADLSRLDIQSSQPGHGRRSGAATTRGKLGHICLHWAAGCY